jgi:GR25 family glycosyltransferase involved in LPS biosynthesis
MCLNNLTSEIYVLNLKKRDDRLAHIERQLAKINCKGYNVIEAIDGYSVENPTNLKNGMYGLILTYFKIYEQTKNINSESIIIIEDDCVFSNNFCTVFQGFIQEVPDDWKILYFGGNHNKHMGAEEPQKVSENVIKVHNTYTAHCIVIKKDLFFDFIDELKKLNIENDILFAEFQKRFPCYSTSEKITWQVNNHSDIENRYINYDWLLKK